jgi:signal transduction histidine kinase/DNA-binding NarL/FixJ family response regulator
VDDEPVVLLALSRSLAQQGFKSKGFSTAEDALAGLARSRPDCIVADYYMPGTNGVDFLREVKRRDPSIARVVLTGGHVDERLRKALDEGTVQVLVLKPWSLSTIHSMMEHVRNGDEGVFLGSRELDLIEQKALPSDSDSMMGLGSIRVLVVDDDPSFLQMVEHTLLRIGCHCRCLLDANSILEVIRADSYHVVLMDLLLPGRSGLEAISLVRKAHPNLPVLGMTCSESREMAVDAYRHGATGFLKKPFALATLEDTLRRSAHLGRMFSDYLSRPDLNAILELQHAISAGMPVSDLLDLLLQQMIRLTGSDTASILLVEPDGRSLRIAASYGLSEEVVREERVAIGERVSGWVAENNQPQMIIGPGESDPRLAGVERESAPAVGLCLPMRGRESLSGVLCLGRLESDELFSRDAIDLGMLLSGEVARAMERVDAAEEQQDIERAVMRRDKLVTIGELASGVAHEINNPLGYVNSNLNSLAEYLDEMMPLLGLLAGDDFEPQAALDLAREIDLAFILGDLPGCITETRDGVRRVLKIVNDLKSFTRDDMESREEADVCQVLDGAINILWNQIKHKAELTKEYSELPAVPCFPSQLGQVFLNLLYNAVQSIERDGRVTVVARQVGQEVIVQIKDNGCGMKPEVLGRIFEPFFTTKPRGVGTGLGLSIAKKIVERHGGRLTASSVVGAGTTFEMALPIRPAVE